MAFELERAYISAGKTCTNRSLGGVAWATLTADNNGYYIYDLATSSTVNVGIKCDGTENYFNYIYRFVFEFTTTMTDPEDGFIELWGANPTNTPNPPTNPSSGGYDFQFGLFKTTFSALPTNTTGVMEDAKWFGTQMAELVDVTTDGSDGVALYRFRLTEAGLAEIAAGGTFYWAMLSLGDRYGDPFWSNGAAYYNTLVGGNDANRTPYMRHNIHLFKGHEDLKIFSPQQGTTHPSDDADCTVTSICADMSQSGTNYNSLDQMRAEKVGDGTVAGDSKTVYIFDFSAANLSGTLAYAKFMFMAYADDAAESAGNLQVGFNKVGYVPAEADGDEYASGQTYTSQATWDAIEFADTETYKVADNYAGRYYPQGKFVEAYSGKNESWLAELQKVVDGDDGYTTGKAQFVIYNSTATANLMAIINGTVADQKMSGPYLILGFIPSGGGGDGGTSRRHGEPDCNLNEGMYGDNRILLRGGVDIVEL
jgi:hypothetical protein